ncbi:hypothetical protein PM082_013569 [Marasmius tenuissimus]|nr:hypothetical protein PM082_013569 [Marasmius tenuissimus]
MCGIIGPSSGSHWRYRAVGQLGVVLNFRNPVSQAHRLTGSKEQWVKALVCH